MNQEYSLYSILVVLVGHGLVYLAYCILTVPFSFIFSIILNRYNSLNLLTICITSLIIAAPFFILFGWSHTGEISKEWWKMYTNTWTIFMALFPGLCYWLFLINLKDKE
jgi:type IV secretory pathway VirB6-like protein